MACTRCVRVAFVLLGIAPVLGLASMFSIALAMIRSGRGMQTYRSVWLVEDSWIGFVVFVGCAVAARSEIIWKSAPSRKWSRIEEGTADPRSTTA